MDAKLFSSNKIRLTGTYLSLILGVGLIAAAVIADGWAGRSLGLQSLTLPLVIGALATGGVGYWAVPFLQALKAGQVIREDGPQGHLKKAGTPTMGGVFIVPVGLAIALLWSGFSVDVVAVSALTLAYGFIGWLDDWQILRRKSNKGISPRMKLGLQMVFGILFCLWLAWIPSIEPSQPFTTVALPFGWAIPLGLLFWPLALFVPVAESNATNLTDGVDGLAAGTGAIALLGLGAVVAPLSPGLMLFCAALSGAYLGFLAHNRNPARVFMGDTGSLALGGALAAVGLLTNTLWLLLILSGLFFAETVSVIAQVTYYKATKGPDGIGKRLLRMAPLHHHLELSGWHETQVVGFFYGLTGLLAILGLAIAQISPLGL